MFTYFFFYDLRLHFDLREFFNVFTSFLQRLPNHFFPFYFFSITQFSPPPHFFSLLSPLFFLITLILFLYQELAIIQITPLMKKIRQKMLMLK